MKKIEKPAIIVTGNSSGDLDSLVCSYVKAQLIRLEEGVKKHIVSLFQISRSEWKLHPEADLLFRSCNVDLKGILYLDELPLSEYKKLSRSNDLGIILTDHNQMESVLSVFKKDIIEIVDHHLDTSLANNTVKKTIFNTGSCSTLIAEQFFTKLSQKSELFNAQNVKEIANLLYFTIRIDTDHLAGNPDYDLKRDLQALKILSEMISLPEDFITQLKKEKNNFRNFTLEDHLSKDYKSWQYCSGVYGISSVYKSSDNYIQNPQWNSVLTSFMKKKEIQILFLMHLINKPIIKRELTVAFSQSFHWEKEVVLQLRDSNYFNKKKVPHRGEKVYFFTQNDSGLSRKKIQPYLGKILDMLKDQP